jgi:hypothetical protein
MTSDLVSPRKGDRTSAQLSPEQVAAAAEAAVVVAEAKARGLDGLLKVFTKKRAGDRAARR